MLRRLLSSFMETPPPAWLSGNAPDLVAGSVAEPNRETAFRPGTLPEQAEALREVAQQCWLPLYTYARRRGASPGDSLDLTRRFLAEFPCGEPALIEDGRGRLRTFLLGCFTTFLARVPECVPAAERVGPAELVDAIDAENRYQAQSAHTRDPGHAYARQWAQMLVDRALSGLRVEYAAAGKLELHDGLQSLLWENAGDESCRDLASRLRMTDSAVRAAMVRLQRRCRLALLDQVARTVGRREDVEDEFRQVVAGLY